MEKITDILVIVDPTTSDQPAIEKANLLAAGLHASVELLVCETKQRVQRRSVRGKFEAPIDVRAWLDDLAAPLRAKSIPVRSSVIRGDPLGGTILRWLQNSPADLLIKDTHHHTLMKRTFLGNADRHLIRECPLPLLLTKRTRWHESPCVAAAIDPPHMTNQQALLDRRILECAETLSSALHGPAHVLHALSAGTPDGASGSTADLMPSVPDDVARETALRRAHILSILAPFRFGPEHLHVETGAPGAYLLRMAEVLDIDIMVLGALSRSHLQQVMLGSTAERLLEYLPCDMLLVKAAKFGECLPI